MWLALALLCAAAIFAFSATEGDESDAMSMSIAGRINFMGMDEYMLDALNFIVRKTAHFAVFFTLGFCLANTLKYFGRDAKSKRRMFWLSWGIASAYGVFDEIHQYFVPGRSCTATDMLINAAGAFCGVLAAHVLLAKFAAKRAAKP